MRMQHSAHALIDTVGSGPNCKGACVSGSSHTPLQLATIGVIMMHLLWALNLM